MTDRMRFLLGLLAISLSTLNCYYFYPLEEKGSVIKHDDLLQKKLSIEWLQNYSNYIGFEGKFSQSPISSDVVIMTNTSLCADDFLETVPPEMKQIMKNANFKKFQCDFRDIHIDVDL